MSVIKDMTPPPTGTAPPTDMAAKYEEAWNEVVMELPAWKKKIIIEGFEVVSGHHVYKCKMDQRISDEVAHDAARRAEASN